MQPYFPRPLYEQQREDIKKVFEYVQFIYQQPRDSNQDNNALINICDRLGKIIEKY